MGQWTLEKMAIFPIWLLFNWYYTIYYKNACLSVTFQLWMISTHCLALKNNFFDIQDPHLATLNMILWKKIGQMTIKKFKLWKLFCNFSIFFDPLCFLMAKKGFSSSNLIEKGSFYLIKFIKLVKHPKTVESQIGS